MSAATPFVIAISGPSGAGKTTVTQAVAERLDAASLFFDGWTDDPPGLDDARLIETSDLVLNGLAPPSELAAHVENAVREAAFQNS